MSYHLFYKHLDQSARKLFPGLKQVPEMAWDRMVSPLELVLPKSLKAQAEDAIQALYQLSRKPSYQKLLEQVPGISEIQAPQRSVLMAYDFHTDSDGKMALVEINTNAAGFMFASLMEMIHGQIAFENYLPLKNLQASFENEWRLWTKADCAPKVAIIDEDIFEQKMLPEFLIYKDWFESFGWQAELKESKEYSLDSFDFIYNRLTDFYLEQPQHQDLAQIFKLGKACLSPNPREYWLLADKQRLVQFGQNDFLDKAGATQEQKEAIQKILLPTFDIKSFSSQEEIWAQRKSLFFKPKRSHGGKSVYRGESVSRKVFERLMSEDVLIQNYFPAQRFPADDERSVLSNWKFDLRFYVYEDQIQLIAARAYQGQVTNFSSPLGGFTLVQFK